MLKCACGRVLVPCWTYALLICPGGCREPENSTPIVQTGEKPRYFIPGVPAAEINTHPWMLWDGPLAIANGMRDGTWVVLKAGDPPIPYNHTHSGNVWQGLKTSVWEQCSPPEIAKK